MCPTQDRVEGWDAMKPLYYRSVSSKGAGRPRLTHHHMGWWNETKWMKWVWRNGGMKFVVGENGRNPEKNLPRSRFVHHETHMEWPRRELGIPAVGGERLTACATRPLRIFIQSKFSSIIWCFLLPRNFFPSTISCSETYRFRAAGTSSNWTFKSPASAGDKVIVI